MSETAKTYINVAIMLAAALILGMLLGDSITYFLGTDEESVASTVFNDRMSLVKQIFAEENEDYQLVCNNVVNNGYEDFRVLRNNHGEYKVILSDGSISDLSVFDGETKESISRLFEDDTKAMAAATDYAGDPITDVRLTMMVKSENQLRWYHYYSNHGWIAVLYADKDTIRSRMDIITLSTDDDYDDGWGILYSFE